MNFQKEDKQKETSFKYPNYLSEEGQKTYNAAKADGFDSNDSEYMGQMWDKWEND